MKNGLLKKLLAGILAVLMLATFASCYVYEEVPVGGGENSSVASGEEESDSVVVDDGSSSVTDDTSGDEASSEIKSEPVSSGNGGGSGNGGSGSGNGGGSGSGNGGSGNGGTSSPDVLNLVVNGVGKATIVIAKNYTDKVLEAATDLQNHIQKMTGVTLPIGLDDADRSSGNYILVGPSAYTKKLGIQTPTGYPGVERVIMKRDKNYLVLMGNDDGNYNGTQFAVTMFLEELGCGWFAPESQPLWTVIPSLKNIQVKALNVNHTPKFSYRMNTLYSSYRDEIGDRWYLGGDQFMTGHGLPHLVGKDRFADHPEWFSLIDGVRTTSKTWWQYCYSNKELAKEMGEGIIAYFDSNPLAVAYPICANDGWDYDWCECKDCAAYPTYSDLMIAFANNVADVVAKKYPEKRLQILSYHATLIKPQNSTKVRDNVEIMFCTETSVTAPTFTDKFNKGYDATSHNTFTEPWKDNVTGYIRKTGVKNVSIWKWYCIAAERKQWEFVPWVQGNVAIDDQNFWKSEYGAKYVFYDTSGPAGSFALRWPLWFVMSKGMWDASLTGDEILADACDKLYGKASDAMLKYYQALAKASEECKGYSILWVPPAIGDMYTPAQVAKIDACVSAAEALKGQLTKEQAQRMEETFKYWKDTKAKYL